MVEFKGTKSSWGLIAKLFHWSLAILLFWQVATGISIHNMEFSPVKIGFITCDSNKVLIRLAILKIINR